MPRILVVDDEPLMREMLTRYLARRGYAVTTAADGAQAMESLKRSRPDLIILDLRMPVKDGLEVLEALRQEGSKVPVIMVTCNQEIELAMRAMRLGACDYITKPIDLDYLETAVLVHSAA